MTQDQTRAEFEAWFVKYQQAENPGVSEAEIRKYSLERCTTGEYCFESSRTALAVWQAARAAAPAPTQQSLHVDLPEAQCEIEVRSHATYVDHPIYEWRDNLPDGTYKLYTEQQVRTLLDAAAQRGGGEPTNQAETCMDTGVERGCEVLPEVIEKALDWIECDTREHVRDCIARNSDPNDIYGSLDQLERILRAAPWVLQGWMPIESAPKDGTEALLMSRKGRIANGCWMTANNRCGAWLWPYIKQEPAFWMPLPQPPKEQT